MVMVSDLIGRVSNIGVWRARCVGPTGSPLSPKLLQFKPVPWLRGLDGATVTKKGFVAIVGIKSNHDRTG